MRNAETVFAPGRFGLARKGYINVNNVDADLACSSGMTEKITAHALAIYTLNISHQSALVRSINLV